jgi:hypothetical protein
MTASSNNSMADIGMVLWVECTFQFFIDSNQVETLKTQIERHITQQTPNMKQTEPYFYAASIEQSHYYAFH